VSFAVSGGDLVLDDPAGFAGGVANFAKADKIDIGGFAFTGTEKVSFAEAANLVSGTLTLTNGTSQAHLTLLGTYNASAIVLANDDNGFTLLTHS